MNNHLEQTKSLWMQSGIISDNGPLTHDQSVHVCVIGAGIAGLTTAYLLLKEGRSVVVLDDGPIGGGQTERTTAHLTNAIDDRFLQIEAWHGVQNARLAAESHAAAIERVASIVENEKIDCDFSRLDGFLFASPDAEQADYLVKEFEAALRAGITPLEWVNAGRSERGTTTRSRSRRGGTQRFDQDCGVSRRARRLT